MGDDDTPPMTVVAFAASLAVGGSRNVGRSIMDLALDCGATFLVLSQGRVAFRLIIEDALEGGDVGGELAIHRLDDGAGRAGDQRFDDALLRLVVALQQYGRKDEGRN